MEPKERGDFLRRVGRERLARLEALCHALGKPFTDFYQSEAPMDWYQYY